MSSNLIPRVVVAATLTTVGMLAVVGSAAAHSHRHYPPHESSSDVRDYNTHGMHSAHQPHQPYFNGGPARSTVQSGYGLGGDPADGLLAGNLPVPAS